jgi:hypothetical protein
MPWKECHVVDERLRFVARLLDGETMMALCAEFGISRKTGNIYDRYKDNGATHLRWRFANAEPEPDFRYRSNATARSSSANSMTTSSRQGRPVAV